MKNTFKLTYSQKQNLIAAVIYIVIAAVTITITILTS